jgi:hypothetical protein
MIVVRVSYFDRKYWSNPKLAILLLGEAFPPPLSLPHDPTSFCISSVIT